MEEDLLYKNLSKKNGSEEKIILKLLKVVNF